MKSIILKLLGIYPETIINEAEKCENLLRDFSAAFDSLGISNTLECNADFLEDMVLNNLEDYINVRDITNSIIRAYHEATIGYLECVDSNFFEECGISFYDYVNADDSHIGVHVDSQYFEYPNSSIKDILQEACIMKDFRFYQEYADDKYLMGEIASFWQKADFEEVAEFYTDGIIPEKLKYGMIDAYSKVQSLKDFIPKELLEHFNSNEAFVDNLTKTIYDALPEYCEEKCLCARALYYEDALYLECLKEVMNYDAEISSEVQKGIKNKYCVKNGKIQETKNNEAVGYIRGGDSYTKELSIYKELYLTCNDDNENHLDVALINNDIYALSAEELHKANVEFAKEAVSHGIKTKDVSNNLKPYFKEALAKEKQVER